MSCILYSKRSYELLSKSRLFWEVWRDLLLSYYESPEAAAEAFFNLNVRAFCDRYEGRYEEEREEAARNERVDSVFQAFADAERRGQHAPALAALWCLASRVEYQCSDEHDAHDDPDYWRLVWVKDWAGRAMARFIEEAYEVADPMAA